MNPAIEKELSYADRFMENLQRVQFWRWGAIQKNAMHCRSSLDKAFGLAGQTGNPVFDLGIYVVNLLPWFLPITLPALWTGLLAFVTATMSVVTQEEKVITVPLKVLGLTVWNTTKTVTVPVVHAPDPKLATATAVGIILIGMLIVSAAMKYLFLVELKFRRRLLLKNITRADG
jgi:hypothetical protein